MTIRAAFESHRRVAEESAAVLPPLLEEAAQLVAECLKRPGGKVLVCGNGGSASDSQHFAAELVGRYQKNRAAFAAIALSTDTSALTAIANDYGYERVFARQVEALGRPGDLLIAISTSGRSPNVIAAAAMARELRLKVIGFTGRSGAALGEHAHLVVPVPSDETARIQEIHAICLHALVERVESLLEGAAE
jgi:D-sedoheptulose 7-phosphate isomerase